MQLIASTDTPKLRIFIETVATRAPKEGIAAGQPYFINPAGARVAATNTLVEVAASDGTRGWYTLLVAAADTLSAGVWTLVYQTPTTSADQGSVQFTVDSPVKLSGAQTADITGNVTGNLSGSVGSVTGAVGSVTGAVGSVAGNVDGDVGGAVVGAVASVTGNVGGNVVGSVASVTARVNVAHPVVKNVALANFVFLMTDSTSHAPATGKTVTATRSVDGGAFGAGTLGAVAEMANGLYKLDLGAGDLNGKTVVLRFTAAGCDDSIMVLTPTT